VDAEQKLWKRKWEFEGAPWQPLLELKKDGLNVRKMYS